MPEVGLRRPDALPDCDCVRIDASTGFVGAMPHGFVTADGGISWQDVSFGNAVNTIRLMETQDGITGYAVGTGVHRLRLGKPRS